MAIPPDRLPAHATLADFQDVQNAPTEPNRTHRGRPYQRRSPPNHNFPSNERFDRSGVPPLPQMYRPAPPAPVQAGLTPPSEGNWPFEAAPTVRSNSLQRSQSPSPSVKSSDSSALNLSPEEQKDLRDQGKLEVKRARIDKAQKNLNNYRKPFNAAGRFVAFFAGFSGVSIAVISTVAALLPHATTIALFAAPQFAIPMAVGIVLVGLLVAWGIRSIGRAYARRQPDVKNDAVMATKLKQGIQASSSALTGPRKDIVRTANRYLSSVGSVSRDAAKSFRDGLAGVFWPVTTFIGLSNAARRKW